MSKLRIGRSLNEVLMSKLYFITS